MDDPFSYAAVFPALIPEKSEVSELDAGPEGRPAVEEAYAAFDRAREQAD